MAYEVVKRVGKRAYRYSVESYRDPESKKVRARWTYVGPVLTQGEPAQPVVRRTASATRVRLLDAFERLLETQPYSAVTAGAVAVEASVAHGTFYRYFSDKRALLVSALQRIREEVDRVRPSFDPPYGTRAQERARMRKWLEAVFAQPAARPGVMRAWFDALDTDSELRLLRLERRQEGVSALHRYLVDLHRRDTIALEESELSLASALIMLVDAAFRARVVESAASSETAIAGVIAVCDRSIFGTANRAAG